MMSKFVKEIELTGAQVDILKGILGEWSPHDRQEQKERVDLLKKLDGGMEE